MNRSIIFAAALAGGAVGLYMSPTADALEGPTPMRVRLAAAPGDSLRYTLNWGAARGATSYRVSVRAVAWDSAGWQGLPNSVIVTGTSFNFTAVKTTWDSVQFRAEVYSRQNAREFPTGSTVTWSVRRLGPPGPITVDSSLIITGLNLVPDNVNLVAGRDTATFCALLQFRDGAVAFRSSNPTAYCDSAARATGRVPSIAQQLKADSQCVTFRTVGDSGKASTNQTLCEGEARISASQ
jgi:hypothetical protein